MTLALYLPVDPSQLHSKSWEGENKAQGNDWGDLLGMEKSGEEFVDKQQVCNYALFSSSEASWFYILGNHIFMAHREKSCKLNACEESFVWERIYTEKKSYKHNQRDFYYTALKH